MEDFIDPQDLRMIETALQRLNQLGQNLLPMHQNIGEYVVNTTLYRFDTGTAPDGSRWAPNSQATMLSYLAGFSGSTKKNGQISKAGASWAMNKKPLIGRSRELSTQIHPRASHNELVIGSQMEYAAMMQYGGTKAEYPNLWGDIPARPFLGINATDAHNILNLVEHEIERVTPQIGRTA